MKGVRPYEAVEINAMDVTGSWSGFVVAGKIKGGVLQDRMSVSGV